VEKVKVSDLLSPLGDEEEEKRWRRGQRREVILLVGCFGGGRGVGEKEKMMSVTFPRSSLSSRR